MPMREELYIPKGHPLDLTRSATSARCKILDDSGLTISIAYSAAGLIATFYVALVFPLFGEVCALLMTMD